MALSNGAYVSVFKLNGKPILPPVIDENRRIELNQDRMLAIEIERRLLLKRAQRIIPNDIAMGNLATYNNCDDSLNVDGVECNASNCDTSAAVESLLDDTAQTFHDVTLSHTGRDMEKCVHISSDESHASDIHDKPPKTVPLTLTIDSNFDSITPRNLSPSFSLHSSPSVGALNESRNLSLYFTPTSGRESFSPIAFQKNEFPSPRLIRSNSYTLDKPSPMLLKHIESSRIQPSVNDPSIKSPMAMSRFQNSQNNTASGIPRKSTVNAKDNKPRSSTVKVSAGAGKSVGSPSTTSASLSNGSTKSNSTKSIKSSNKSTTKGQLALPPSIFKNNESILRSIYGQKPTVKVQHSAKKSTNSSIQSSDLANKSTMKPSHTHIIPSQPSNNNNNSNTKLNTQNYNQILAMFEQQHSELLKRQQEEQQRMQEEFLRQQQELLQKMQMLIASKGNAHSTPNGSESSAEPGKKSNEKMLIDEVNNELPVVVDSNGNRVNRFTPESEKCIRRLHYEDNGKLNVNNNNINDTTIDEYQLSPSKLSTDESEQFEMYTVEEVRAASVIVAHAKGNLTRRLLKTKKVQDLRKMQYDTLELLLDISEEDTKNESKSDVEFKFNLLQQLASVGGELYQIFFKIPMVERMDVIAKDRIIKERQQFNLNRSKSVENNKSNSKHINGNSLGKTNKALAQKIN